MYAGVMFLCLAVAPPPSPREMAEALIADCQRAGINDAERAMLSKPGVFKEVCRIGVARGWCDPAGIEQDKPETVLRFCRSMLRKEKK